MPPLVALVSALVLVLAVMADPPPGAAEALLLAALAGVGAAGAYRPFRAGHLGLGAIGPPLATAVAAPSAAGLVAVAASWLAATARRRLRGPKTSRDLERRGLVRRTADALSLGVVAMLAAVLLENAWLTSGAAWWSLLAASAAVFAVGARLLERLPGLARRDQEDRDPPWPRELLGVLWDALGWTLGIVGVTLLAAGWQALAPWLVALVAVAVGAAVAEARNRELRHTVRELERVSALAQTPTRRRTDLPNEIVVEVGKRVEYEWVELRLLEPDGSTSVFSADRSGRLNNLPAAPPERPRARLGIHRRRPWLLIERELGEPGQSFGQLRLWCDPREVERSDLDLLDHLMPQLSAHIERSWLARAAAHDHLTGLPKREVFESGLHTAFEHTRSTGLPVAVILLDIDHFKAINDTYGHGVGDAVLAEVAKVLDAETRDDAVCCRYGGEEFAVLIPGGDGEQALAAAERLRRAVDRIRLESAERDVIEPTISAGVASFPELYIAEPEELLELADRALYAAKSAGRNRCLAAIGPQRFRAADGSLYGRASRPADAPRL